MATPSDDEIKLAKSFIACYESIDWTSATAQSVLKTAYSQSMVLIRHLKAYLGDDEWELLLHHLWLHKICCNPNMVALYAKHDVANKAVVVKKNSSDGEFLMLDLNRTPYGREAYTYLEGMGGLAIAVL